MHNKFGAGNSVEFESVSFPPPGSETQKEQGCEPRRTQAQNPLRTYCSTIPSLCQFHSLQPSPPHNHIIVAMFSRAVRRAAPIARLSRPSMPLAARRTVTTNAASASLASGAVPKVSPRSSELRVIMHLQQLLEFSWMDGQLRDTCGTWEADSSSVVRR